MEDGGHRPHLLHLEHPAGGEPGPGAPGIEPEVDDVAAGSSGSGGWDCAVRGHITTLCSRSQIPHLGDQPFLVGPDPVRDKIPLMFPDNLTRAETRARAELVGTHSYRIEVDLSGRAVEDPERLFRSDTTITFEARAAGDLHVDLIADHVEAASLDGVDLDPATFADSRLPLTVTPGPHTVRVLAHCRYSRSGEGLHRFVDPADKATYLYTQFEPADARRVFADFEQPDLKAEFTISVLAPEDWTVVSNGALLEVEPLGDGNARFSFAETKPISTYLTALVAGDYHRTDRTLATAERRGARRPLLPPLARPAPGRGPDLGRHRGRLRRLRAALRAAVPVRQVRPGVRPGVQRRRDGERRVRDPAGRVRVPQPGHPRLVPGPRRHDPARAVAHVVRRPGDDALVGRPVAEGVLRHLGLQLRPQPDRRRPRRRLGLVHQRVQDLGLPAGPAALDAPDRGRHGRSGGGRAELRRHHLRQGRLGAGAAGGLRRPGGLPGRVPAVLPAARVRQHSAQRPAGRPARRLRPGPVGLVRAVAGDHRGEHPAAGDRGRRRGHHHLLRRPPDRHRRAPDAAAAPDRHRPLRRRPSRRFGRGLRRGPRRTTAPGRPDRDRHRRRADRGGGAGRADSSHRCCWSTTTTCPTPRSGSIRAHCRQW